MRLRQFELPPLSERIIRTRFQPNEVGVPSAVDLATVSLLSEESSNTYSGIALANPKNAPANVNLVLRDSSGTQVASKTVTIPQLGISSG